jgi:hypothetical protein
MRWLAAIGIGLALAACKPTAQEIRAAGQRSLDAQSAASGLAARSEAAQQAADRFVALAAGATTSGQAPRQSDPVAGPLLNAVLDTSAIPVFTGTRADMHALEGWMGAVTKVGRVYLFAGTGVTDPATPMTDALRARVDQNLAAYAPEIGRYLDAQVVLFSRDTATGYYVQATGDYNETQRDGALQDLRAAVRGIYAADLDTIARTQAQGIADDAWRLARVKVMATMAPRVGAFADPTVTLPLQHKARDIEAVAKDPALKAELQDFIGRI